jgi:hypothetical protein
LVYVAAALKCAQNGVGERSLSTVSHAADNLFSLKRWLELEVPRAGRKYISQPVYDINLLSVDFDELMKLFMKTVRSQEDGANHTP